MGLYYQNTFFSTGGKPALTGRQQASQYSCQLLCGIQASRRKRHREPTSDASATNSRRQDCNERGQASCQLYNLQSVPSKFHSKSCGTCSHLKEYLVRRGLAASLYQVLVLLVFPGCPTAGCHRNAKTQVPPQPGYCPCTQGQALLRQGQGRTRVTRGSCPQARPPSLLSRLSARGQRPHSALRDEVAQHHWSAGHCCQFGIGWPGQMPAWDWSGTPKPLSRAQSLWDPVCWGLAAAASLPLHAAALPYFPPPPQEGTCPKGVTTDLWEQQ